MEHLYEVVGAENSMLYVQMLFPMEKDAARCETCDGIRQNTENPKDKEWRLRHLPPETKGGSVGYKKKCRSCNQPK